MHAQDLCSRSGATIAAGLGRGLRQEPAARFSFLLATPIILGAGLLKVVDLARMGGLAEQAPILVVGFLSAGVVGFGCIHFLLHFCSAVVSIPLPSTALSLVSLACSWRWVERCRRHLGF